MSIAQEERNALLKRFSRQALIHVDDSLYSAVALSPNVHNKRMFPVHAEAVERLNSTMQRHIDGNAQIFYTMIYKDVDRTSLITRFWNGLIGTPEFRKLPKRLQELEHEQARKLGPTSRFSIEKLFDAFINHIDEEAKTRNKHWREYREAAEWFAEYVADVILEVKRTDPSSVAKYFDQFYDLAAAFDNLNKDKSGGDPYFIRVDRKIAGEVSNKLYLRDSQKIMKENGSKEVYYEMFIRVQNKGNNIIPDELEPVTKKVEEPWLPEKNRVVQGDSRAWQFILKNMSDLITKIPKMIDPIFVGWADQQQKNKVMEATMKEYRGKFKFDSFDATDYDASTDPDNFWLGIWTMYRILENVGLEPDRLIPFDRCVRHYLNDATLTPWGAFERDSTPSGHNFTGPNGTITNLLRCYVQTKRLLKVTFQELNARLKANRKSNVAMFAAVGDDAFQLRGMDSTPESIAEENNSDGYKSSDSGKVVLDEDYIHFLQFAYYYDGQNSFVGFYPVSRVLEHCLFQERADQYTATSVVVQGAIQNINNAKDNPLQDYLIDFLMEGDVKYRLGSKVGVMNLFREASEGRTVAETLGREWDPAYATMSWERYSDVIRDTVVKIESRRGKFS